MDILAESKQLMVLLADEKDVLKILEEIEVAHKSGILGEWGYPYLPDSEDDDERHIGARIKGTSERVSFYETDNTSDRPSPEFILFFDTKEIRISAKNYEAWEKARELLSAFTKQANSGMMEFFDYQ